MAYGLFNTCGQGGWGHSNTEGNSTIGDDFLMLLFGGIGAIILPVVGTVTAITLPQIIAANPSITAKVLKLVAATIIAKGNPKMPLLELGIDEITSERVVTLLTENIDKWK